MNPRALRPFRRFPVAARFLTGAALSCFLSIALTPTAYATFHFARIVEVFGGTTADPDADYIVIKAHANLQDEFLGVRVEVYDAQGNQLPDFGMFLSDLPSNVTNQKSILMATPQAQQMLGIAPDGGATGTLPQSGVVCFQKGIQTPDCVSYGNFTGNTGVGGSQAGPPAPPMPSGSALRRDLGADGLLQAGDDTDNSSEDFDLGGVAAENFAGTRTSELALSKVGSIIRLSWTDTADSFTIHKTDDPATARNSAPVAAQAGIVFVDPNPDQFPGLTCYVVKP